ncbi:hypothetical protein BJ508DRAFT_324669 [Ascobolus immersus RN42]|uniref:Uncharacterized protein n=1 Tax=Ascobolus immersus RN42 TaxID=1160509 RepID=A0A3N4IBA3_ASCIM|nr:hypothetical protein BJ508DRAFT_324669 [Ascobolus immersus RN42]
MKFVTIASTTVALLSLGVSATAVADLEAAHALYPRGSVARDLLKPEWGKGAFGGRVSAIPVSEAGVDIDEIVTVHTTVTVTVPRSKVKRDHAPTAAPVAKRNVEEVHVHAHGHGHGHGHHHHHHHHNKQKHVSEKVASEPLAEQLEKLSKVEEAKLLNDAFSLEMLKLGGACNTKFGQAVCIDNKVAVCATTSASWEAVTDCTAARRRCGAMAKDDGILVSCLNINEVHYPEQRPSEKFHDSLRK